ncbi:MAG: hypothetical protein LRY46_02865 [Candidatus Pacebacteria bacterium]|nr:hypothetical protein [Candidatus Paceibacterota bacterium]
MSPLFFYGAGKDAVSIAVHYNDFVKLYKEAGETHVIDLITDQGTQSVLVHDMQQDPVSNKVIHS